MASEPGRVGDALGESVPSSSPAKEIEARGPATLIEAIGIEKRYGTHRALHDITLSVAGGEFLALVGPSGCGKTSLLKILAGFEELSGGTLRIEGKDMSGIPPSARPTRMVFQKLALFPHKTVRENIAFSLKLGGCTRAESARRVAEMMSLMHLQEEYAERLPHELSGGEQQRVALARSMITQPSVLLLDEPLSALDVKLKQSLQAELKRLHRSVGTSFVHVTHDLEEAMMLADRICVMRDGRILQIGEPSEIYYRPIDAFVAGFIGDTNLLSADVRRDPSGWRFRSDVVDCADPTLAPEQAPAGTADGEVLLMVRPELLRLLGDGELAECVVEGVVQEYFIRGATVQYRVLTRPTGHVVVIELPGTARLPARVDEPVRLGFERSDVVIVRR